MLFLLDFNFGSFIVYIMYLLAIIDILIDILKRY